MKSNIKHNMQRPKVTGNKTFQHMGKWIERPVRSEILVCACANKYIKTRDGQTACLKCMSRAKTNLV